MLWASRCAPFGRLRRAMRGFSTSPAASRLARTASGAACFALACPRAATIPLAAWRKVFALK